MQSPVHLTKRFSDVLNRHIRHHHPASGEVDGDRHPPRQSIEDETEKDGSRSLQDDCSDAISPASATPPCQNLASPQSRTIAEHPNIQTSQIQDHISNSWDDMQFDALEEFDAPYNQQLLDLRDGGYDAPAMDPQFSREPTGLLNTHQELDSQEGLIIPSLTMQDLPNSDNTSNFMPLDIDFGSVPLDGHLLTPPRSGDQQQTQGSKKNISDEQFEQVRRLWPTRRRTVTLIPSSICWDDILLHPEDNVFSSTPLKTLLDSSVPAESSWNFNSTCRDRLLETVNRDYLVKPGQTLHLPASLSNYGPWDNGLPPTDILDLCLDLYFYRFHVHMPFVHPGTFNASETPSILLFPMCVVGMMLLNRAVAHKMVTHYIPVSYLNPCFKIFC